MLSSDPNLNARRKSTADATSNNRRMNKKNFNLGSLQLTSKPASPINKTQNEFKFKQAMFAHSLND